jgi:hypothetical protein
VNPRVIIAGTVGAVVLTATVVTGVAFGGPQHGQAVNGIAPPTPTSTIDPTDDPTTTTTVPTTTTTVPTSTTTTSPTSTTTTTTTTMTTVPPRCVDPGPRPGGEQPPSDDPAVPPGTAAASDALAGVGGRIVGLYLDNGYPGFAGVVADPVAAVLTLYWLPDQPLPPEIEAIVSDPGQGVQVIRADAGYSRARLESASASLLANIGLSDQICAFLHTVKAAEEGSGLSAVVEPYDTGFDAQLAQQVLTAAAGVPVAVEVGPQPEYTGRVDDTAPWYAGGRITVPRGSCSTAFGVVDAGTRTREYMLSALHCAPVGAQVRNGDGTRILGPVAISRPQWDSEVIRVTAAGTKTFFGGVNGIGAPERSDDVRVAGANVRGTTLACTSGASTGENCALRVTATNVATQRRAIIGGRVVVIPGEVNMVIATSTVVRRNRQLAVAIGQGDSGGPVVTDATQDRKALGTISAGVNDVSCGLFAAPNKRCFSSVFYADINILLRGYTAALR